MSPRKKTAAEWPFGRKFTLWLADKGLSLSAFASRNGFIQSTLQRYVKAGMKMPASALAKIATATRLSADYWLDDTLGYPAPIEYANLVQRVEKALQAVPQDELVQILEMTENVADRRRTLAMRRAARGA